MKRKTSLQFVYRPAFMMIGLSTITTLRRTSEHQTVLRMAEQLHARCSEVEGRIGNELILFQRYPTNRVFTDTVPYSVVLGVMVEKIISIPVGMIGQTIPGGEYAMFTHTGTDYELGNSYRSIYGSALKGRKRWPLGHDYEIWNAYSASGQRGGMIDIYVALRRQQTYRRSFLLDEASIWPGYDPELPVPDSSL